MKNYIIFILLLSAAFAASAYYRKIAFQSLVVKRSLSKNKLFPGEVFKISINLENRKAIPVSFLHVEELIPKEVQKKYSNFSENRGEVISYKENYAVGGRERVKRSYEAFINKRGVYFLRNMELSIVDFLGIDKEVKEVEDFIEIVVYPKLKSFRAQDIASNSILGDSTVKRWIYQDPIFVKGIREYTTRDRMKDIHWNSTLKGGRMMVKDYDYTSDKEVILLINVQYTRPFWNGIREKAVDKSCEIAASLAESFLNQGVAVGVWSNAHMISYNGEFKDKLLPSLNNMDNILEFCGRIDNAPRYDFYDYFKENIKYLNNNGVYVIITAYMPEDVQELLKLCAKRGYIIKLIDISKGNAIPELPGIEKLSIKEEV